MESTGTDQRELTARMTEPLTSSPQPPALILASASPRRRELLAALGLPFSVVATDVDETLHEGEDPASAAVRLARRKAEAAQGSGAVTLGADTVVVLGGRVLGKPADADEAAAMLRALRRRTHTVITGVSLRAGPSLLECVAAPVTRVTMRNYSDAEIGTSIAAGTPFDKAGAYAIQDTDLSPVAGIDGCYCNVVGLPLWTVYHLLRAMTPHLPIVSPVAARPICAACPLA